MTDTLALIPAIQGYSVSPPPGVLSRTRLHGGLSRVIADVENGAYQVQVTFVTDSDGEDTLYEFYFAHLGQAFYANLALEGEPLGLRTARFLSDGPRLVQTDTTFRILTATLEVDAAPRDADFDAFFLWAWPAWGDISGFMLSIEEAILAMPAA